MTEDRTLTEAQREVAQGAEFALTEALVAARRLALSLDRGAGGREAALLITKLEEANHWLQECCWRVAGLDGPLRADRPWEGPWNREEAGVDS